MADQPSGGHQFTNITAAGSVVVSNTGVALKRVILGGTYVGTVEFYNSATVAGTAAANNIYTVGLPLLNQYKSIDINANARNGLVYVATGTPTMTFAFD